MFCFRIGSLGTSWEKNFQATPTKHQASPFFCGSLLWVMVQLEVKNNFAQFACPFLDENR